MMLVSCDCSKWRRRWIPLFPDISVMKWYDLPSRGWHNRDNSGGLVWERMWSSCFWNLYTSNCYFVWHELNSSAGRSVAVQIRPVQLFVASGRRQHNGPVWNLACCIGWRISVEQSTILIILRLLVYFNEATCFDPLKGSSSGRGIIKVVGVYAYLPGSLLYSLHSSMQQGVIYEKQVFSMLNLSKSVAGLHSIGCCSSNGLIVGCPVVLLPTIVLYLFT
jgi:hypothetical protein